MRQLWLQNNSVKTKRSRSKKGPLMVSAVMVRSENELREFYEWLLCRVQEKEANGNKYHARLYQEYADIVKIEINNY